MKKIMILGAGSYQLPAIKKAVELGLHVITVDYLPNNIGHKYSHQHLDCSTIDKNCILRAAEKFSIHGIITLASDIATSTVAYIAEKLKLPGGYRLASAIMSNKAKFRTFQKKNNLPHPNFIVVKELKQLSLEIHKLKPPVVFKPVDSSGSRGISRVDTIDSLNSYKKSFEYAKKFSNSGTICVEEFINGIEVGGDAFILKGEVKFISITEKHTNRYIVIGHSFPTNINISDQKRIKKQLKQVCNKIGYLNGPINFDIMVNPDEAQIIEMSPRLGGNGIPVLIERFTGCDIIKNTINYAIGGKPIFSKSNNCNQPCGSYVFGSKHSGVLKKIASANEIKRHNPEVFDYNLNYKIGEKIPAFTHNGNSLGIAFFDLNKSYNRVIMEIANSLKLELK